MAGYNVTREDIERFFNEAGWKFSKSDDDWEVRYRGDVRDWIYYVRLTDYWLYFYATVLNKVRDECKPALHEHIGYLNYKINLGKYSINNSGGISLGVELPRENMQQSQLSDALAALSINSDEQYIELLNLANEPGKVSSLRPNPTQADTPPSPSAPPTPPSSGPASGGATSLAEDSDLDLSDENDSSPNQPAS